MNNLTKLTAYNMRNGSTSTVAVNKSQITTISYGDVLLIEDEGLTMGILCAKINFSGGESVFVAEEVVEHMMASQVGFKDAPKSQSN